MVWGGVAQIGVGGGGLIGICQFVESVREVFLRGFVAWGGVGGVSCQGHRARGRADGGLRWLYGDGESSGAQGLVDM